ncbi:hypothetical protein BLL52_0028 [Rhodoferax antarcticus ANT.BR]|uniref:Uncharacterized protein n=1 Tax=Rhodoferax antarcticus ANT.BR TaxID=1111071 RepID=A0A1Q8YK45_9BURK|nr:hypothetical protein BLL52_0028 [Rhodoferax antarcticus ANT.BR]
MGSIVSINVTLASLGGMGCARWCVCVCMALCLAAVALPGRLARVVDQVIFI